VSIATFGAYMCTNDVLGCNAQKHKHAHTWIQMEHPAPAPLLHFGPSSGGGYAGAANKAPPPPGGALGSPNSVYRVMLSVSRQTAALVLPGASSLSVREPCTLLTSFLHAA